MKFGNFREKPYTQKMDFMDINRSEQLDTYSTVILAVIDNEPILRVHYSKTSGQYQMKLCKRLSLSSPNAKQSKKVEILTKRFSPFFAKKQVYNP
ncbi:hypothetical protein T07_3874 [Trichinella nelsoni]|uniref:Uncharacterized protein n=1 Tax=Trichinella nelsoni TaxID=6336 RepID=A0A0V0RN42_9BILA|nr:hypothetical protein T07_5641 [Trichinella nelsoni]KRX15870.1 hypothetical protein T07_3874 [Trichinella nelsoni]